MFKSQPYKISTYIYVIFVESFCSLWAMSILPQIITYNFGVSDPAYKSSIGARYNTFNYIGLVIGSFWWPICVKLMSKRNCILFGIIGQAISNYLMGQAKSMEMLYFWRAVFGFFHISHTVGKDFLYEFAATKYCQMIFTWRSIALMVSSFFAPLAGFEIYYHSNKSFGISLGYISLIYLSGALLFFIGFYIFDSPRPINPMQSEESLQLLTEPYTDPETAIYYKKQTQIGMWDMIKYCYRRKELRRLIIGYSFIFAVYNAQMFVSIFYIETPWSEKGLGLNDMEVSIIVCSVFAPILVIFLISPKYVPSKICMFSFTRIVVFLNAVLLLLLPGLRDIFDQTSLRHRIVPIYITVALSMIVNPNLASPFLNYYMNNKIPKNGRTAFNSLTYICLTVLVIIVFVTMIPFFSLTIYDPYFVQFQPYNKYFCFLFLNAMLIAGACFLRPPKKSGVK